MNYLKRLWYRIIGVSPFSARYDINHIHPKDPGSVQRWTAPQSAAARFLEMLNEDEGFLKHVRHLGRGIVLIRMALIDNELRVCTYVPIQRDDTNPLCAPIFDEDWANEGYFHYLSQDGKCQLMTRDSHPYLHYDRSYPEQCFTYPLTATEMDWAMSNRVITIKPRNY